MTKCIRCGGDVGRPGANQVRYDMPPPASNKVVDYCDRCAPLVPALQREAERENDCRFIEDTAAHQGLAWLMTRHDR